MKRRATVPPPKPIAPRLLAVLEPATRVEVTRDATLRGDLGLDELDVVELALDLTKAYGRELTDTLEEIFDDPSLTVGQVEELFEVHR